MTLVARLRNVWFVAEQRRRAELYAENLSFDDRQKKQLGAWNIEWQRIILEVPYFTQQVRAGGLPKQFTSWQEFIECVPITTRADVQKSGLQFASTSRRPDFYRTTGGSTAQPIQLPSWSSEVKHTRPDVWLGRSRYGVRPDSRLFLIWGHSHLLGTGFKRWQNSLKRETADRLLGYSRFSAYDLTNMSLRRCAAEILKFQPNYILGYGVALDRFARANQSLRTSLRALGVKTVIGTAEGFPAPDSEALLSEMFDCPVAMEYGSVETDVMAYTHPDGGYRAFWHNYFLEVDSGASKTRGHRLRITSLYPRCFPLVRYDVGDEIELCAASQETHCIDRFKSVLGRCNDYAELPNGTLIHSEAFTHAIRTVPHILAYQVVQDKDSIEIRFVCDQPIPLDSIENIRSRLQQIHPLLAKVEIRCVPSLEQTVAGKIPMVLRRLT